MTRLGCIPFSRGAVRQERYIGQAGPSDAVAARGHADLLRVVVVAAGIEHVERVAASHHRGRFNTVPFPRQFRSEHRAVVKLDPRVPTKVGLQVRAGHTEHLDLHPRIARGKPKQQPVAHGENVGVDGASRRPGAAGAEDGVGRIAPEAQPVLRDCMAECIPRAVAVSLVEQMDFALQHDGVRCAKALPVVVLLRPEFPHLLPA